MADRRLTGILLVGGASRRFGSPKALAQLEGVTLAERAHGVLLELCDEVIAMGKARDALPLPFPILDDGSDTRAAIVGLVAGLRAARHDLSVVLPTDVPLVTPRLLALLADAAAGVDAAVTEPGPLPGAYRRSALPVLEGRLAAGEYSLRGVLAELRTRVVRGNLELLRNVNRREDLSELAQSR